MLGEIGTWDAMTPDERKVFRAAAKAHRATNLAIVTHTNLGKGAMEQLDVLEAAGVSPACVAAARCSALSSSRNWPFLPSSNICSSTLWLHSDGLQGFVRLGRARRGSKRRWRRVPACIQGMCLMDLRSAAGRRRSFRWNRSR